MGIFSWKFFLHHESIWFMPPMYIIHEMEKKRESERNVLVKPTTAPKIQYFYMTSYFTIHYDENIDEWRGK